ncbi:protein unc-13 homolog B-like [Anguilla rostrata]|uniref:protein unc-13 homolog B-like n=1 Tax=Anguilla rostrata TaxID=7938 RepID=UPI0030D0C670
MYLLCIKVKRARLHGPPDKFNVYVIMKVQNLKSTTPARRGNEPLWEQDYMFEIKDIDKGLCVEVWDKGLLLDTLLGSSWVPLSSMECRTEGGPGQWWPLHGDIVMEGNEICGAKNPTGHEILLDIYYELPTEIPDEEAHFLIQRLKALYIEQGELKESEEEQDCTKDTDDNGDATGDTALCSPIADAWEQQGSEYCREYSPTSPCAVGLPGHSPHRTESPMLGHSPHRTESPMLGPVSADSSSRSLEHVDLAVSHRSEAEACSTSSWAPSSHLSPESLVPLDLTDR